MKKIILTAFVLMILLISLKGQTKQSEVVSSSGGSATLGTVTLDWTLGEVIVGTASSSQTTLTQGFQQSFVLTVETAIDLPNVEVSVYPNPTANFLQVSTKNLPQVEFYLFNLKGTMLLDKMKSESNQTTIDMSDYPAGIYLLEIIETRNGQKESIKIIKR